MFQLCIVLYYQAITPPANAQVQGPPPAAAMLAASVISASIQGQDAVTTHGGLLLAFILFMLCMLCQCIINHCQFVVNHCQFVVNYRCQCV